jgi:2-methylcitrate dehydratase PrpD
MDQPMREPGVGSGAVARLASYIATARDAPLPDATRDAALRCVFDLLGAAAAGLRDQPAPSVRHVAARLMGGGACPIWFTGETANAIASAWANSAAASALDLDDGHRLARGHPGAAVIPAALAIAAEIDAPADAILRAIAIGYEVGVTIGAARTTYGNTGTWSAYAVAAAAGSLRRTSEPVLEHALAIAGESAPNQLFASAPAPREPNPEGSAVKEGIPWSVVTGMAALDLAEAGHTGPRNILESTRHYRLPDPLPLGRTPHIHNAYFKLYACCRHVHAPLDALLALIETHRLDPSAISAVEVETYGGALRISNRARPADLTDAQYSIPYCLGLAALRGAATLLPLTAAALFHEDVARFAQNVTLRCVPDLDARFPAETLARVAVTCAGQRFISADTAPRGEASTPLSWAELEDKFHAATRFAMTMEQRGRVLNAMRAAREGDLSRLTRLLGTLRLSPGALAP